jgi:polyphosphate kinase
MGLWGSRPIAEHARVYYFRNGGEEEYFISSADAMKRNLEYRVEVLVPVESLELRKEIRAMLDAQLNDRRSSWELKTDGSYLQLTSGEGDDLRSSHEILISLAEQRQKDVPLLRKIKVRGFASRHSHEA